MFKKVSILMGMLVLFLGLTACGATSEEEDILPQRGSWDGDVFVNEYLGIQFQLPEDWYAPDEDQLAAILGLGTEVMFPEGSEITDEILEFLEEEEMHDLYAINLMSGSSVQVLFSRLPRLSGNISVIELFEITQEELAEEMDMEIDFYIHSGTTTIGRYDFYGMDWTLEFIPGMEIVMRSFVNIDGRNIRTIMIGAMNDEEIENVLSYFSEPDESSIESTN